MKTKIIAALAFVAVSVFAYANTEAGAEPQPQLPANPQAAPAQQAQPEVTPDRREAFKAAHAKNVENAINRALLSASDEDLEKLASRIEEIRKMTAEEKAEALKALPKPEAKKGDRKGQRGDRRGQKCACPQQAQQQGVPAQQAQRPQFPQQQGVPAQGQLPQRPQGAPAGFPQAAPQGVPAQQPQAAPQQAAAPVTEAAPAEEAVPAAEEAAPATEEAPAEEAAAPATEE